MKNSKTKKMYAIVFAILLVLGTAGSSYGFGGWFSSKDRNDPQSGNAPHTATMNDNRPTTPGTYENRHTVPEPATMILLGAGLGSLALYRRRSKK